MMQSKIRILGVGRKSYLEFLRNLTPQILLLSFSIITAPDLGAEAKLSDQIARLTISLSILLAFSFAAYANCSQLYNTCFLDVKIWAQRIWSYSKNLNKNPLIRLKFALVSILKSKLIEFLEMFFVMLLFQISLAIVVVAAIYTAKDLNAIG